MHYVYLIDSLAQPSRHYVGFSGQLRERLAEHKSGKLPNTARYRP
jgi:predicted GIY-YIG superfamily endonuclease